MAVEYLDEVFQQVFGNRLRVEQPLTAAVADSAVGAKPYAVSPAVSALRAEGPGGGADLASLAKPPEQPAARREAPLPPKTGIPAQG